MKQIEKKTTSISKSITHWIQALDYDEQRKYWESPQPLLPDSETRAGFSYFWLKWLLISLTIFRTLVISLAIRTGFHQWTLKFTFDGSQIWIYGRNRRSLAYEVVCFPSGYSSRCEKLEYPKYQKMGLILKELELNAKMIGSDTERGIHINWFQRTRITASLRSILIGSSNSML